MFSEGAKGLVLQDLNLTYKIWWAETANKVGILASYLCSNLYRRLQGEGMIHEA